LLLLYITDRTQLPGDEDDRQRALLAKIAEATRCGVDLIQLREKDLSSHQLEALSRSALRVVRENSEQPASRLLINSRSDIAIASGADGVHLRSEDVSPSEVQKIWAHAGRSSRALVSVSCHSATDVGRATDKGADFALFAPVFEKKDDRRARAVGLEGLRNACRQHPSVFALGGITLANARACIEAGAVGIAGIRLFQDNDVAEVVRQLRD